MKRQDNAWPAAPTQSPERGGAVRRRGLEARAAWMRAKGRRSRGPRTGRVQAAWFRGLAGWLRGGDAAYRGPRAPRRNCVFAGGRPGQMLTLPTRARPAPPHGLGVE